MTDTPATAAIDTTATEEPATNETAATELAHHTGATLAVTPQVEAAELVARLNVIRQAMDSAMTEGIDYGRIPGIDKPSLLKPGSEKLGVLFQLDIQLVNDKTWGPGDHLTVISHATVYHAPTGSRLGYGEGLCTTREKKYGKRKAERVCPNCGKPAIIKGKAEYAGGWLCWKKKDGCDAKFSDTDKAIVGQEVGEVDNPDLPDTWNCVTPETRILTRDLRWIPAGDLESGDILISVAEENRDQYGRPYEDAVVTVGDRFVDERYELTMEDGRTVRCNGEHRWLVKCTNSGVEWVTTEVIFNESSAERRTGRPRKWRILGMGIPWEQEDSTEAGYLAGLFDADGSLDVGTKGKYHSVVVSFAQQMGGVLGRLTAGLEARRFEYSEYPHLNPQMRAPVVKVHTRGGIFEQMRLLGTIRPPRLLERWAGLVDLSLRRFEGRALLVESVERVGPGELVQLGTSSHTYIAEGLVCHNTIIKMAEKRARVDAVLAVTGASALFTQDAEDAPRTAEAAPEAASVLPDWAGPASDGLTQSLRKALAYLLNDAPDGDRVNLVGSGLLVDSDGAITKVAARAIIRAVTARRELDDAKESAPGSAPANALLGDDIGEAAA